MSEHFDRERLVGAKETFDEALAALWEDLRVDEEADAPEDPTLEERAERVLVDLQREAYRLVRGKVDDLVVAFVKVLDEELERVQGLEEDTPCGA